MPRRFGCSEGCQRLSAPYAHSGKAALAMLPLQDIDNRHVLFFPLSEQKIKRVAAATLIFMNNSKKKLI